MEGIEKKSMHIEQLEKELKIQVVDKIAELGQKLCKKYKKVIEAFIMGDGRCSIVFHNHALDEEEMIYGSNDILDKHDWDLIDLYGLDSNKDFQQIVELLDLYEDKFYITDNKIEIFSLNNFVIDKEMIEKEY